MVVQHRFPLLLRKLDPETSISTPVPTRLFHRGSDYSHPRNLYSHARNPYSHPPGIFIHIAPESLFTCPGIRISAASPVALGCSHDSVQRNATGPTSFCHMSNAQFCRLALENDFSRKLHVEELAGPNAKTAEEIADRVGHKAVGSDGSTSGREVDPVEDVEHFRTKL